MSDAHDAGAAGAPEGGAPARFWEDAKRYSAAEAAGGDAAFVREMAYVMVTLHRNGA